MNVRRASCIAGFSMLSLASLASADDVLKASLDRVIDTAIAERRIVGTVVVASVDGKIVYERAAGLADREANRPMTPDTLFRLASVSKPVVTTAALALLDAGKLDLDVPVTNYLPDFKPRLRDGTRPTITVRQLMTHTAGLGYGFGEAADGPFRSAGVSTGLDQPGLAMDEEIRRIAAAPLVFPPGTAFGYSVGIDVLGAVCERAAGAPLADVVRDRVTGPLGAKDLSFAIDRAQADRLATPYADAKRGATQSADAAGPVRMTDPFVLGEADRGIHFSLERAFVASSFPSGGAGMIGTAGDVWRVLENARAGGGTVLRPETANAMLTNQIGELRLGPGMAFGFGGAVIVDPIAARTPLSPGSWTWGGVYGHNWFIDPARKLTVVALTNTTAEGMSGRFTTDVRDVACAAVK